MPLVRLDVLQQFAAVNLNSDPGAVGGKVKIPQAAQVTIIFQTNHGTTAHGVLYGRYVGAFDLTQAEVDAMRVALTNGAAWTALAAHIAPTAGIVGINVRNVNEVDQPIIGAGQSNLGTSTGSALPDEVAVCVTFRTAKAGKSGRGRLYMPGWATTALGTANVVAPAAVTALQNWATSNIPAMMSAGTLTHCLGLRERMAYVSPITGTQHPARPATTLDVSGYLVRDNHWDTQRRRGLS